MTARGVTELRTVDALDRVTFVDYPDDTLDTTYTYDDPAAPFSQGRLTAITRNGHSVDYRYDRFGRTIQDGELTFQYDRNGNRTGIGYPGGVSATYDHDFADRETSLSVTTASGTTPVVTAASYLPSGRSSPFGLLADHSLLGAAQASPSALPGGQPSEPPHDDSKLDRESTGRPVVQTGFRTTKRGPIHQQIRYAGADFRRFLRRNCRGGLRRRVLVGSLPELLALE